MPAALALGDCLCGCSAERLDVTVRALSELATDAGALVDEAAPLAIRNVEALMGICRAQTLRCFKGRPLHEVMPMIVVAMLVGMIYFAFAISCGPLSGFAQLSLKSAIFHVALFLAAAAYHRGVVTDPGYIPDDWSEGPRVLAKIQGRLFERKQSTGKPRFCSKERKYKPDRAHFCGPLQRNVLRMDHYCPWMSNCIGFRNHKFFVLFLLYSVVAVNTAFFSTVRVLACQALPPGTIVFLLGGVSLTALLAVVLTPFLLLHLWLLSKNMTTIEFCEQVGRGGGFASSYDLGVFENLRSILGDPVWLWLLPVGGPSGEGLFWPRCMGQGPTTLDR